MFRARQRAVERADGNVQQGSTGPYTIRVVEVTHVLGCLAGSAGGTQCSQHLERSRAPARSAVVYVQWGVAPRAQVQGRTRHHGESRVRKGGSVSERPYAFYVGVDWASETHQFTVLTPERRLEAERRIEHTGRALGEMTDWLTALADGEPARIAVAIEVPRGPVVETLLERGFHVFAINPKQLDRFRDRHSPAGDKDDRLDGFVPAAPLPTDRPAFLPGHVHDTPRIHIRE